MICIQVKKMSRRGSDESIGKERKRRGRHLDDDKESSLYQDIDDASIRLQSDNEGKSPQCCSTTSGYRSYVKKPSSPFSFLL